MKSATAGTDTELRRACYMLPSNFGKTNSDTGSTGDVLAVRSSCGIAKPFGLARMNVMMASSMGMGEQQHVD